MTMKKLLDRIERARSVSDWIDVLGRCGRYHKFWDDLMAACYKTASVNTCLGDLSQAYIYMSGTTPFVLLNEHEGLVPIPGYLCVFKGNWIWLDRAQDILDLDGKFRYYYTTFDGRTTAFNLPNLTYFLPHNSKPHPDPNAKVKTFYGTRFDNDSFAIVSLGAVESSVIVNASFLDGLERA